MKKLATVLVALGLAVSFAAPQPMPPIAEDEGRLREGQDEVGRHDEDLLEGVTRPL